MDITADLINEARSAISKVPFKGADQYITERQNVIQKIANANKVRADDLMNAVRQNVGVESVGKGGMVSGIKAREKMLAAGKLVGEEAQSAKSFIADAERYLFEEPLKKQDLALKTKKFVETASAPMETPYGKSFLSYTPEGKVAGVAGKALRGLAKVAGPVGATMTAGELGGALVELRKLGAEKIAANNKANKKPLPPKMPLISEAARDVIKESLSTFAERQPDFQAFNQELQKLDQKMKPKMIGKPSPRKPFTGLGRSSMKANPTLRQGE